MKIRSEEGVVEGSEGGRKGRKAGRREVREALPALAGVRASGP